MARTVTVQSMMQASGVKFGTSGARGLVTGLTDEVCYCYTVGFLKYLEQSGQSLSDRRVALAGDLRPSTDRIMAAVSKAVVDCGCRPVNCGKLPSPAVALFGLTEQIPAVMVTGSHIPDDRNGIKYNKPTGEVLKTDETGMKAQSVTLPDLFDDSGMFVAPVELEAVDRQAELMYLQRYIDAFGSDFLAGMTLGCYQHSAVGRDLLVELYRALGAEVIVLGRSDRFVSVDTEAIRPEDVRLARQWSAEHTLDAIVSTDGDSDRPLISDAAGKWLRGDVAGILVARYFGARAVVTPVSCNTAVDQCRWFEQVKRTKIGSPYVIAEMMALQAAGRVAIVGYEANGGFLTQTTLTAPHGRLPALPTRDAVIVHLGVLGLARREGKPIAQLLAELPQRFTASDRLEAFPTEISRARIDELIEGGTAAMSSMFGDLAGAIQTVDTTDGLRMCFEGGQVIHLRPSGNAPELRCYTESDSEPRAVELNRQVIELLRTWR